MCNPAIIFAAVGVASKVASDVIGANAGAAQADAARQMKINAMQAGNYQDQNLRLQQRSSWDSARAELTESSLKQLQTTGAVKAAIGESNMEGNSMDRLLNVTTLEGAMDNQAVKDNEYNNQSSLYGERVMNKLDTKNKIDSINGDYKKPNKLMLALSGGLAGMGAYNQGQQFNDNTRAETASVKRMDGSGSRGTSSTPRMRK